MPMVQRSSRASIPFSNSWSITKRPSTMVTWRLNHIQYSTPTVSHYQVYGTVLPPGEASWKGWLEGYGPFMEHFHEAQYVCIYERNGGLEMVGLADIYANLPVPGEKTKTDASGCQWDVLVLGALLFNCVKDPVDPKGFNVKSMTLFGDGVPAVGEMMKRGMLKPVNLSK